MVNRAALIATEFHDIPPFGLFWLGNRSPNPGRWRMFFVPRVGECRSGIYRGNYAGGWGKGTEQTRPLRREESPSGFPNPLSLRYGMDPARETNCDLEPFDTAGQGACDLLVRYACGCRRENVSIKGLRFYTQLWFVVIAFIRQ